MCKLRQRCSQSMLQRTCEYMHGSVRLGELGMSNGWCTLYMPFYFKPWGIKKYSIPYMMQIELTYISIESGVVNRGVYGFFICSGKAMVLPPYYLEVILCGSMASSANVAVYRGGFL